MLAPCDSWGVWVQFSASPCILRPWLVDEITTVIRISANLSLDGSHQSVSRSVASSRSNNPLNTTLLLVPIGKRFRSSNSSEDLNSKFVFIRSGSDSENLSRISPLDDQEWSRLLVVSPCFELESDVSARSLLSGNETASAMDASANRVSWHCCLLTAVSTALYRLIFSDQRVNPLISDPRFAPDARCPKLCFFFLLHF